MLAKMTRLYLKELRTKIKLNVIYLIKYIVFNCLKATSSLDNL